MGNQNSGRRKQPTALKILRGNPSKVRISDLEPKPPSDQVVMPATLSPGAIVVWNRTAPICLAMKTLTCADVEPFARMCELQASFDRNTKKKGTKAFEAKLEIDLAGSLLRYSALFGMEPVSRSRIQIPKANAEPVVKWSGMLK